MNKFNQHLIKKLTLQKQKQRFRSRRNLQTAQDVKVNLADGKSYLNFSSNDYLGLANHPHLKQHYQKAIAQYGCGSGASHLMSGHSIAHARLEEELASFLSLEACLLFSCGYMANLGILNAVLDKNDQVFQDKLNHASLIDAGLAANAKMTRFPHLQYESLEQQLVASEAPTKMIISDGVFSMDGDTAPLNDLLHLATKHQTELMLDDAHGFGVLGENGKGSPEYYGLKHQDITVYMATFGKAVGVAGAFVTGSAALIENLVQFSRTYTYTTAMPAAQAEVIRESLKLMQKEAWRREKLNTLIIYFKQLAKQAGLTIQASDTAIQPLMIGKNEDAIALSEQLLIQGFLVTAIRPPTVPENTARLRITLSANHQPQHLEQLIESIVKIKASMSCE